MFQAVVVVKYLFQFGFFPWNDGSIHEDPFWPPRIIGIEKKNNFAAFDILLLFCLFIHRSVLKVNFNPLSIFLLTHSVCAMHLSISNLSTCTHLNKAPIVNLIIKSPPTPPTMWWKLNVLMLSIVIIIILQQFDDVNALQSPIFIQSS